MNELVPAGTRDFHTASGLCRALVLSAPVDAALVDRLCKESLGADTAFLLEAEAAHRQAPEDRLLETAIRVGTLQRTGDRLALRVGDQGAALIARRAAGIDDLLINRFAALAGLLGDALALKSVLAASRDALHSLQRKTRTQSQVIDHLHDSVIVMDLAGFITSWNLGAEKLFGYTADEAVGQNILFLYAGEESMGDLPFNQMLGEQGQELRVRRRKKTGEIFWASISLSLIHDEAAQPAGVVGYLVDITDRLQVETDLRLHGLIFERSTEAIIVTDAEFRTVSVNPAFAAMTGYAANEILGQVPGVLRPCSFGSELAADLRAALDASGHWQGELWDWRKNEQIFPAWISVNAVRSETGALTHFFIVMSDMTERKEAEARIYRLAYYDALTGLPNRDLLYTLVEQTLAESHRASGHGALLFVNINRFKDLNDSFGHDAADALLREIALRLQQLLRDEDVVARVGGDEFVVGLFDLASRDDAAVVARKIMAALNQSFLVDQLEVLLSASIGVAVYPEDGRDADTLIRAADLARQRAKKQSAEGWLFYATDMNTRSIERLKLETGLRRAIEKQQFVLHYQPQIDLASGALVGAEALVRWQHPVLGMIPPGQFIPLAEETGLIAPIGEWVLDEAIRQIAEWQAAGCAPLKIAVNLSSRQFHADLPGTVRKLLDKHRVDARWLELELTESMLMRDAEEVIKMMDELRAIGLTLSLDDFGTGFSSLAYLKRFPIDKLKIDQSFIRGIPDDAKDMAITRSIIHLAQYLDLKVLAEGVETVEQSIFLKGASCEQVQGFLYSRPIDVATFDRWRSEVR